MSEIEAPSESLVTASAMLFDARTAMGLSQKDVADQLFLTTTFIRYIDDGEFEKIPKAAFVKGYIRSYARVVGLDGNEVIAIYERDQQLPLPTPAVGNVTEGPLEPTGFQGPIVQTGIFGLVALVLVVLLVWWLTSGDDADPAPGQATPAVSEVVETPAVLAQPFVSDAGDVSDERDGATESAGSTGSTATIESEVGAAVLESNSVAESSSVSDVPVAPLTARASLPATSPETAARLDRGNGPEMLPSPAAQVATSESNETPAAADSGEAPKEIQVERVVDGETTYVTVYAAGDDEMQFSFNDECWVEIEDGDGDKIYGDLNRAGDIMTIYGRAPFDVLLGRAPAASMTYQGQPVDLARFTTRDQTAKIRTARL